MLKYLVILLDKTSVSFCHYDNPCTENGLISIDDLRAGILYGMKENLNIQFVYPAYELPAEYKEVINTIDHTDIKPAVVGDDADVVVVNGFKDLGTVKEAKESAAVVLRCCKAELFAEYAKIAEILNQVARLNVVITDVESFTDEDFETYKLVLDALAESVKQLYVDGKSPQLNLLTDRMMLEKMNNCNAGWESITLAPDGKFYVCPAFYHESDGYAVGDLATGLDVKNPQLYRLDHAPICRKCDAYHCRRCIWLNRKTTLEVNTPSREQCVVAHLERNASRDLLAGIRQVGDFLPDKPEIPAVDYLDPFDVVKKW